MIQIEEIENKLINILEDFRKLKNQENNRFSNNKFVINDNRAQIENYHKFHSLENHKNQDELKKNTVHNQNTVLETKTNQNSKIQFRNDPNILNLDLDSKKTSKLYFRNDSINFHQENITPQIPNDEILQSDKFKENKNDNNDYKNDQTDQLIEIDILNENDISISRIENQTINNQDSINPVFEQTNIIISNSEPIDKIKIGNLFQNNIKNKINAFHSAKPNFVPKKKVILEDDTDKTDDRPKTSSKLSSGSGNRSQNFIKKKIAFKSQIIDAMCDDDYDSLDQLKYEVNMATMGAIIIDVKEMRIIYTNNEFNDHLFQDRIELIGNDIFTIMPESEKDTIISKIASLMESIKQTSDSFDINFFDKNLTIVTSEATLSKKSLGINELILIYINSPINEDNQIFNPTSTWQICWVGFITFNLLFITTQMPYDMTFNESAVTNFLDIPITIVFFIDILLNFNLAIEIDQRLSFDRYVIISSQMKGWFWLDFITTVPIGLVLQSLENTALLRSLKILRIFRFIKLLRLIKLSKIGNNIVLKDEFTKSLYKFFKQNQGYFDLLKNMMQIYLFGHQQTIIFQQLEDTFICNHLNACWLEDYRNNTASVLVSDQNYILYQNIKIALGLDNIKVSNNIEAYMAIIWMFIGLSLFGQGIGNISAYLSYTNKEELEHIQTYSFFNELCFMNNIDPRLQSKVLEYVDNQQAKQLDRELMHQQFALPPQIFEQVEINMQVSFVKQFPLLEKLNTISLRKIKHNCIQQQKKNVSRRGISISNIYFILDGSINLYDENMHIKTQYETNEVQGLSEFYEQIEQKQKIDIQEIFSSHNDEVDSRVKKQLMNTILSNLENNEVESNENISKVKRNSLNTLNMNSRRNSSQKVDHAQMMEDMSRNNRDDKMNLVNSFIKAFENIGQEFKMTASSQDDQLISNQSAICSDEVKLISVPQIIIEEILFEDVDSFQQMWKYFNYYNREILDQEWEDSDKILADFNDNSKACAIVRSDGRIFDVNDSFCTVFDVEESRTQDLFIMDLLELVHPKSSCKKVEDIEIKLDFILKLFNKKQNCVIENSGLTKIVGQDRKSNLKNHQMTFAKSIMPVYILEFDFENLD